MGTFVHEPGPPSIVDTLSVTCDHFELGSSEPCGKPATHVHVVVPEDDEIAVCDEHACTSCRRVKR